MGVNECIYANCSDITYNTSIMHRPRIVLSENLSLFKFFNILTQIDIYFSF